MASILRPWRRGPTERLRREVEYWKQVCTSGSFQLSLLPGWNSVHHHRSSYGSLYCNFFRAAWHLESAAASQTTQSQTAQQAQQPYNQSDAVVVVPEGRLQVLHELGAAWCSCSAAFSPMHVGRWGSRWLKHVETTKSWCHHRPITTRHHPASLEPLSFWKSRGSGSCLPLATSRGHSNSTHFPLSLDADSSKKNILKGLKSLRRQPLRLLLQNGHVETTR